MSKNYKIPYERRSAILAELALVGSTIAGVAKSNGVSKSALYAWSKEKPTRISQVKAITPACFVELIVDGKSSKVSQLQKTSLVFDDYSLVIEGSLSVKRLLKIIESLEEIC